MNTLQVYLNLWEDGVISSYLFLQIVKDLYLKGVINRNVFLLMHQYLNYETYT
jgi:hypothetical protein